MRFSYPYIYCCVTFPPRDLLWKGSGSSLVSASSHSVYWQLFGHSHGNWGLNAGGNSFSICHYEPYPDFSKRTLQGGVTSADLKAPDMCLEVQQ